MPVKGDAPVLPGARAVARHVRISPTKARRVVNLVRGLPAKEALTVLQFAPQAASEQVYKVVASAIANAENNERLDPDALLVAEAFVDEGPTMKRFRPRAQGRAYRIRKRTCHITIVVEAVAPSVTAPGRAARKTSPAKRAASTGPEPAGSESAGSESTGSESTGSESTGSESTTVETQGRDEAQATGDAPARADAESTTEGAE